MGRNREGLRRINKGSHGTTPNAAQEEQRHSAIIPKFNIANYAGAAAWRSPAQNSGEIAVALGESAGLYNTRRSSGVETVFRGADAPPAGVGAQIRAIGPAGPPSLAYHIPVRAPPAPRGPVVPSEIQEASARPAPLLRRALDTRNERTLPPSGPPQGKPVSAPAQGKKLARTSKKKLDQGAQPPIRKKRNARQAEAEPILGGEEERRRSQGEQPALALQASLTWEI